MLVIAAVAASFYLLAGKASADPVAQPSRGQSFRLSVPAAASAMFRFLPDDEWRDFDRPLLLEASPGEERQYSLEIRDSSGVVRADYLVDRLAPPPPSPDPPPGSYSGPLTVNLTGEDGSAILFSISGPGIEFGSLAGWNPERPLMLPESKGRIATWVLVAKAVDAVGNESPVASFAYKVLPEGVPSSGAATLAAVHAPKPDPSFDPGTPAIESGDSSAVLRFALPSSGQLMAAVNPGADIGALARWQPLETEGRLAILRLRGPYGWSAELSVSIGLLKDGLISFRPTPFTVQLSPLAPAMPTASTPAPPALISGEPGSASLISFPPYDGDILYSLDGGKETPWRGPISLEPGEGSVLLAWRGRIAGMLDSAASSIRQDRPPLFPEKPLLGLDGPLVRAEAFTLSAAPGANLRYEIAEGKAFPAVVTASSPLMADRLVIDTPPQTTRIVTIRYRAFSGAGVSALGGEEGFARLTVDRQPPSPPIVQGLLPRFSRKPVNVSFLASSDSKIMVELDDGSGRSADLDYKGALTLDAAGLKARVWRLSAWAVDKAGNVSTRIGPFSCVVDPAGLYVDQGASEGGNGDPDKPFASIDAALAASRADSTVLRLRSGYRQKSPLSLGSRSLELTSGAALAWLWPDSPEQGSLRLAAPAVGKPAISVTGGSLGLSGLSLSFADGDGEAIKVTNGKFEARDSSISGRTAKTLTLVDATASKVDLKGVFLRLGGAGGGADLVARDSTVALAQSDLGASGAMAWITCLSLQGGSLTLSASRLGAPAGISSVGLSVESTSLEIDRMQLDVSGAAGYRRGAMLKASTGKVVNSHITSSGPPTTIVELRDSNVAFVFDSFIDSGAGQGGLVFSARGGLPLLVDDLFVARGGASLLDSDRAPERGGIGACAFSGFGALVSGAATIAKVDGLPPFDVASGKGASIDLGAVAVLRPAPKGGYELLEGSPIVDRGIVYGPAETGHDFSGLPRPSSFGLGLPDIGADELQ